MKKTILIGFISFFLGLWQNINAQSDTFRYVSNAVQNWTVPGCVAQVTVQLWAGGGAGGNWENDKFISPAGGSSCYYEGVISGLRSGMVLGLYVPHGGKLSYTSIGGAGGWPGGGSGGHDSNLNITGGGGGGYAAIQIKGTYYVVAGAGGGGGTSGILAYGGSGGAVNGGNGGAFYMYGGYGGNVASGGGPGYSMFSCDTGTTGLSFQGGMGAGNSCKYRYGGGGGGAGYYGGGGGGDYGAGGGGGSSWPGSIFSAYGITFTPMSNIQGSSGSSNKNYLAPGLLGDTTIGMGGYFRDGGNGLIIITYAKNSFFSSRDSVLVNPVCGTCNGSAMVIDSGGTSPYIYSWAPGGQTTAIATGLCAGTYTVTVSDSCGDINTASVVLTSAPLPVTTTITAPVECNGSCTGSAIAAVGIGTSPYTYKWAPIGGSQATAMGLCAGIYTVTVTDKNGCTGTATAIITQPTPVVASMHTITGPLCNGGTGGAIATASGGLSPYIYKWNPSGQTTANATGLSAGVYTVTVTDNNSCTATITATITQPAQVTAIFLTNNALCNGGTGSATALASGGISPYVYLWTPSAQTRATATGLSTGTYTIKVSDKNGCTLTNSLTITQPALLTISSVSTPASCNLPNGTATVIPGGGTSPYTYVWFPTSQTTANATGLVAGNYTVLVTDNNHCTASARVTITQPTPVTAAISNITNVACYNGANGSATVTGSGGGAPYTYLWNPGGNTNATATGLFALSYTATVTDNNGCTATTYANLTEPTRVIAGISEPKIICKDSTGSLIANASGGNPPYQYNWSSGTTTGTATITAIATNNYSVIVTDSHGCTASATIALQYGPSFAVDITGRKSVCAGDSTIICANAIGAIDGVTYLWQPDKNTNECISVSPTIASVYTLTVVDGCGATTTVSTTVSASPSPVVNMGVNFNRGCVPFCVQFANQSTLSKGKVSQYIWMLGNGDTSRAENPVYCYKSAGKYDVSLTIISDSGCSATLKKMGMVTIYNAPKADFTYSPNPATIETPAIQFTDKSADASGNIIYWQWNFGDSSNSNSNLENPVHIYQDTGMYCVDLVVMNRQGCTDTTTNCLIIEPDFRLYIPSAFSPNGDNKNEVFKPMGQYIKSFEMYVFNRWGAQIFYTTDLSNGWNGTVNGQICPGDVYIYKIIATDSENNQHSYIGNVTLLK